MPIKLKDISGLQIIIENLFIRNGVSVIIYQWKKIDKYILQFYANKEQDALLIENENNLGENKFDSYNSIDELPVELSEGLKDTVRVFEWSIEEDK